MIRGTADFHRRTRWWMGAEASVDAKSPFANVYMQVCVKKAPAWGRGSLSIGLGRALGRADRMDKSGRPANCPFDMRSCLPQDRQARGDQVLGRGAGRLGRAGDWRDP